ncbi:MAG: hypothetical protein Q9193_003394 [Seirophora villosa]
MGVVDSEFPLLNAAGLYVVNTTGNGNCLFHALSDQLYGDQSKYKELRETTIGYMRDNGNYFKHFLEVHPGGGSRRNPKRKNAGSYATRANTAPPSVADVDGVFEGHLHRMAKGGTYGDNMELVAFSKALHVDVTIYQRKFAYQVYANNAPCGLPNLHIAYHDYEHYSSVRNIQGPHSGIPHTEPLYESIEAAAEAKEQLAKAPYIASWMVDVVMQSQSVVEDRAIIQKKLEAANGDVDAVIESLIESQLTWSSPGASDGSSSISRDQDDDGEDHTGPKKKQDRRLSRSSRIAIKEKEDLRKQELAVRMKDRQLSPTKESASPPVISVNHVKVHDSDETEDEDWRNTSSFRDSESASVSTSASDYSVGSKPISGGVRLKLSQPKKDLGKLQPPSGTTHRSAAKSVEHAATASTGLKGTNMAPRRRRLYRRKDLDMKKAAQTANAMDLKRSNVARARGQDSIAPLTNSLKQNTPAVEARIKVLCI